MRQKLHKKNVMFRLRNVFGRSQKKLLIFEIRIGQFLQFCSSTRLKCKISKSSISFHMSHSHNTVPYIRGVANFCPIFTLFGVNPFLSNITTNYNMNTIFLFKSHQTPSLYVCFSFHQVNCTMHHPKYLCFISSSKLKLFLNPRIDPSYSFHKFHH